MAPDASPTTPALSGACLETSAAKSSLQLQCTEKTGTHAQAFSGGTLQGGAHMLAADRHMQTCMLPSDAARPSQPRQCPASALPVPRPTHPLSNHAKAAVAKSPMISCTAQARFISSHTTLWSGNMPPLSSGTSLISWATQGTRRAECLRGMGRCRAGDGFEWPAMLLVPAAGQSAGRQDFLQTSLQGASRHPKAAAAAATAAAAHRGSIVTYPAASSMPIWRSAATTLALTSGDTRGLQVRPGEGDCG